MQHFLKGKNIGLIIPKQTKETLGGFLTTNIAGHKSFSAYDISSIFPLYLYPETGKQKTLIETAEGSFSSFSPIDILDYIYAVLHSPTYREKYKEFLKIDFPRVPYPKDVETFWQLVALGGQLRQIHLLESPIIEKYITTYPQEGSNVVGKIKYEDNKVWINERQYFDNVPQIAWEFYIGGYQPAQKWLKDRKDRELSFEDILHYQKIIVALSETHRLMKAIDELEIEN